MLRARWIKYTLEFKRPAGTSRGKLKTKDSYFIIISNANDDKHGIGECGILRGLSYDDREGYEAKLDELCASINNAQEWLIKGLEEWPSIYFGLEIALRDLETNSGKILFQNKFSAGLNPIPINGLIWMGEYDFMREQIIDKLNQGFNCIKLKIGAIDFQKEIKLLKLIRSEFPADQLELRVDANGAFDVQDAEEKLIALAKFDLHSIEQPIKAGQWDHMKSLCAKNIIPIALDEELIGVYKIPEKIDLIRDIRPQYIILKPSLVGGFKGSLEWINIAEMHDIKWWITSALESNIGLNAIAQWTASIDNPMHQGLGTGSLYSNNFSSPLIAKAGFLHYDLSKKWDLSYFE